MRVCVCACVRIVLGDVPETYFIHARLNQKIAVSFVKMTCIHTFVVVFYEDLGPHGKKRAKSLLPSSSFG